MKKVGKILLWILVLFVVIQFIPVNRENPPINSKMNFVEVEQTPQNIQKLLKNSCYDCHSFETKYPDYAYIAPISWSIKRHVNEGREHANFSTWGKYNPDVKRSILKKVVDEINDSKMPLPAYLVYHERAKLNDSERKLLSDYFENLLSKTE